MDATTIRRAVVMAVGLAITSAGLTLVFLGMRAVMDVGGYCASGGPYVIAQECPQGTAALIPLGIIGGLIGLAMYAVTSAKLPGPRLTLLAWSALFLSLGWNFWEYGLNPPDGSAGLVWGWIICGVMFVIMGAFPLLGLFSRDIAKRLLWADAPSGQPVGPSQVRAAIIPRRVSPSSLPASQQDSVTGALERLAALHQAGALTDEEFTAAKQRILEDQ
ncbi:MAG TPA: SHOCT domain-containing protein [Actinomycetota bacterium]|nr:SHOCT domain-containing protein [Actinomycetota bacterium]